MQYCAGYSYTMLVIGCHVLVIGYTVLVIGYTVLVIGYAVLVIGKQHHGSNYYLKRV